jgi:hypothetical protein
LNDDPSSVIPASPTSVQLQGVDVEKQGIDEVVTDALALPGIENPPTFRCAAFKANIPR